MKIFISIFCSILIFSCGGKKSEKDAAEKFLDEVSSDWDDVNVNFDYMDSYNEIMEEVMEDSREIMEESMENSREIMEAVMEDSWEIMEESMENSREIMEESMENSLKIIEESMDLGTINK